MATRILAFVFFVSLVGSTGLAGEWIRLKTATFKTAPAATLHEAERFRPTLQHVYYIVQFNEHVQSEWTAELKKRGVKFGSYLPDDAFIAHVESVGAWAALNASSHVRAVIPYDTSFRLSAELNSFSESKKSVQVSIQLIDKSELKNFARSVRDRGISLVFYQISSKLLILQTAPANLRRLSEIEGVEWVEPFVPFRNFQFEINEPGPNPGSGNYSDLTGYESGTKLMNFEPAQAKGLNGEGEIVGISDTGLDRGSLTDILEDFKNEVLKGYALGMFSKSWGDPQGHGTHTGGSIVGSGVQSGGKLKGGAPGARLVMQSMWSPMMNNLTVPPDFENLFGAAYKQDGAHVHSNSWGKPGSNGVYDNFSAQVDDQAWKYPELLIVFAAGNDGQDLNKDGHIDEGSVSSPGTAKNSLTVGASKNLVLAGGIQKMMKELKEGDKKWGTEPIASSRLSETPAGMAAFSSIGPTQDGRLKPDIVAPGTNIISAHSQDPNATAGWGLYNQYYMYAGGTSMATPLTASAATVTRQYLRIVGFDHPSSALVKAAMIHSAYDLFPGQFGTGPFQEFPTKRPNVNEGFGRVDVGGATSLARSSLIDEPVGVKTGQVLAYSLKAKAHQTVRATLVYTDAPAAANAAQALVNDLDLKITGPENSPYFPNHLDHPDSKNNTEMIEFDAPADGVYSIEVRGTNVPKGQDPTGAQPFALVITADK